MKVLSIEIDNDEWEESDYSHEYDTPVEWAKDNMDPELWMHNSQFELMMFENDYEDGVPFDIQEMSVAVVFQNNGPLEGNYK